MGVVGVVDIYLGGRVNRGWWWLSARPNEGRKSKFGYIETFGVG
jgi:hypothetical protein